MPIRADAIARVVIKGEWVSVQRGTFRVEPYALLDESGNAMHPDIGMWAYHFTTEGGDEYYGPIQDIELYKMAVVA